MTAGTREISGRCDRADTFRVVAILTVAVIVGLALRYPLWRIGPRHSFWWDHDDFARWGILAADKGPTALYEEAPPRWPHLVVRADGSTTTKQRGMRRPFNYPPIAAFVHWFEGTIHGWVDADRLINTHKARAVYGGLSVACDLIAAIGTMMLVRRFARVIIAALSAAIVFVAPPLAFDSAFWTQTDAWVLAPLVWMVWAMTTGRWYVAALLWALAIGLKPQGLFAAPIWAYALLFRAPRWRIVLAIALGAAAFNVAALPFWATSGATWVRRAFVENIGRNHEKTSLTAFNVWYVDQLIGEDRDSTRTWLGVSKDEWSRLALAAGLIAAFVLVRRTYSGDPAEICILTAICLLSVLMLSTRVHERYIVTAIPFVIGAAARVRSAWRPAVLLMIVACAQITAHNWGDHLAGKKERSSAFLRFRDRTDHLPAEQRRILRAADPDYAKYRSLRRNDYAAEWALVSAAIIAYVWICYAVLVAKRDECPVRSELRSSVSCEGAP